MCTKHWLLLCQSFFFLFLALSFHLCPTSRTIPLPEYFFLTIFGATHLSCYFFQLNAGQKSDL